MRSRGPLVAVAAIIVLGIVAVWGLRRLAPPADAPDPAATVTKTLQAAPAANGTTSDAPAAPGAATDAEGPPPWVLGLGGEAATATAPAQPTDPEQARRAAQMAQLRQSMDALVADALERSEANTVHVRKALDALEAMDDPAVEAQVNLDAVRHNFEISVQMQALARQLQQAIAEPPSPARQQRIDTLQAEFRALQGRLRTDMTPAGTPLPMPAAPAAPAGVLRGG